MKPSSKAKLGRVDLEVTGLAFGAAPLGNISDRSTRKPLTRCSRRHGTPGSAISIPHPITATACGTSDRSIPEMEENATICSVFQGRTPTAACQALRDRFAPWNDAAPFKFEFDYSFDGTMRAFEDSLQRLALERMDVCFIHDIDVFTRGDEQPECQNCDGWLLARALAAPGRGNGQGNRCRGE